MIGIGQVKVDKGVAEQLYRRNTREKEKIRKDILASALKTGANILE